jgi:hypothetical protein
MSFGIEETVFVVDLAAPEGRRRVLTTLADPDDSCRIGQDPLCVVGSCYAFLVTWWVAVYG